MAGENKHEQQKEEPKEDPHVSSGKWVSPTKGKAQTVPSRHQKPKEPAAKK